MREEQKQDNQPGYWKKHSLGWQESGLTQRAYCAKEAIDFRCFKYQHQLMRKAKKPRVNFIESKPRLIGASPHIAGLQVVLPNGVKIGITNEVNMNFLQSVLTIAGALNVKAG